MSSGSSKKVTKRKTKAKPNTVILYHAQCTDGFGAAFAAHFLFKDKATYHPIYHSKYVDPAWQEWLIETTTDKEVFLLDIALPPALLSAVGDVAKSVEIQDHHASSMKELQDFKHPKVLIHFDPNHSGAALAWQRFVRPETSSEDLQYHLPYMIRYIEDYDLWTKRLPQIEEVAIYLHSLPYDFSAWRPVWDKMMDSEDGVKEIAELGKAMLSYRNSNVERACKHIIMTKWNGTLIPTVNTSLQINEVCVWLLEHFPDAPFAAAYYDETPTARKWSLRSRKGKPGDPVVDVGAIGKAITSTGGGHPTSAGFTQHLITPIIPEFEW